MIHDPRKILRTHIMTERTNQLKADNNEYVFEVDKGANKHHIKDAVEKAFKVKVVDVRTVVVPGKTRRMGRFAGKTSTWKKAIVKLKKDQVIAMFENA